MRNTFKQLIKIGAVVAVLFLGVGFWPALIGGFLAVKAVDVIGGIADYIRSRRLSGRATINEEERQQRIRAHKENTNKKFFDMKNNSWNLRDLPFDMYPRDLSSKETYFTCAGIENVVKAKVLDGRGRKVAFSIVTDSADKAQQISDYIAQNGLIGNKVMRTADGKYEIESDNAIDISAIVKQFYPPRTMCVEREMATTKQFIVSGCKTYEEAVAKFQQNRMAYSPANIYQTMQDTVDGVKAPLASSPNILNPASLEAGSFIINETSVEVFSKNITFNGGIDCTDEALRSEASAAYTLDGMSRDNDLVEDKCRVEITDGLQEEVSRYVNLDGNTMFVRTSKDTDVSLTGASLVFRFKSEEDMQSYLSGNIPTKGMVAFIDTKPEVRDGEYMVTVPLTNELMKSIKPVEDSAEKMYAKYASAGLSKKDCEYACILDDICREDGGYSTVKLADNIEFGEALVNGVPVADFKARREEQEQSERFSAFRDEKQQQQWLKDAASIKAVSINLDLKTQELVITSSVVNDKDESFTKIERRRLSEDEAYEMQRRGDISKAEAKDLLMMMHPDYFKTYSVDGKPMYKDPLAAFIKNVKPEAVDYSSKKKNTQAKAVSETEKKARTNKKTNGMKL